MMRLDMDDKLQLHYADLTDKHLAMMGVSGSGKTSAAFRFVEEMLKEGAVLTILDPEGEYHQLQAKYPVLVVGQPAVGNPADICIGIDAAPVLARSLAERHVSAVVDISGVAAEDQDAYALAYIKALWDMYLAVKPGTLPPMKLVVDEVQLFAPQQEKARTLNLFKDIARRGRKRGFTLFTATQNPQSVNKFVLNQATLRFFLNITTGTSLNAVIDLLPGDANARTILPTLKTGEGLFVMGATVQRLQMLRSETFQPGGTQTGEFKPVPIDAKLIADLQRALAEAQPDRVGSTAAAAHASGTAARSRSQSQPRVIDAMIHEHEMESRDSQIRALRASRDKLQAEREEQDRRIDELLAKIAALQIQLTGRSAGESEAEKQPVMPALEKSGEASTVAVPASRPAPDVPYRSPQQIKNALSQQQRSFQKLLDRLENEARANRRLATLLINNPKQRFDLRSIVRWLRLAESTLRRNPPMFLIETGLIGRAISKGQQTYWSKWEDYASDNLPDLEFEEISKQLIAALDR